MSFNLCYSWPSIHSTGCFISVFTFYRHFGTTRSVDRTTDAAPNDLPVPLLRFTPSLANVRLGRKGESECQSAQKGLIRVSREILRVTGNPDGKAGHSAALT